MGDRRTNGISYQMNCVREMRYCHVNDCIEGFFKLRVCQCDTYLRYLLFRELEFMLTWIT